MSRPVLLLLVATLLLAGGGVATAAWRSTSTGTATARAGSIGTPTEVTIGTPTCTNNGVNATSSLPVTWAAVTGAAEYTVEWSALPAFVLPQSRTVTGTSTTVSAGANGSTVYVRVRAAAGEWTGATSATVSRQIACR